MPSILSAREQEDACMRALAFHEVWNHAPTIAEWIAAIEIPHEHADAVDPIPIIRSLVVSKRVDERYGRYVFSDSTVDVQRQRQDEFWMARKYRVARRVAAWLARLGGVRFVALCNTTALGHAQDESDIDFFVITRAGALMQTRALAALPFKLLGRRPHVGKERDAVCLSYFIAENGLDLSSHMLTPDDPYFRHWFLSLVPLFDDGILEEFWTSNAFITRQHGFAHPWRLSPDLEVHAPIARLPVIPWIERAAAYLQIRYFPPHIRALMNQDTRVIVHDRALKFHVDDGREAYRRRYEEICRQRGIAIERRGI